MYNILEQQLVTRKENGVNMSKLTYFGIIKFREFNGKFSAIAEAVDGTKLKIVPPRDMQDIDTNIKYRFDFAEERTDKFKNTLLFPETLTPIAQLDSDVFALINGKKPSFANEISTSFEDFKIDLAIEIFTLIGKTKNPFYKAITFKKLLSIDTLSNVLETYLGKDYLVGLFRAEPSAKIALSDKKYFKYYEVEKRKVDITMYVFNCMK